MNIGFTYPTGGIGYIGPILMIIALVAMPVIGVFGGWKRAAYWGGGNFVFYIVGMLIWRFAGYDISGLLNSAIGKIIANMGASAELTPLVNSVLAPLFFIIFLLLANIILVINYYAWFRRVSGIRKVVKKKGKDGKVTKQVVKDFDNKSTGYKTMSHIVGGFGLLALTVPTIMSFTRASLYLTTSINTRANNKFVSNLYNGINGVSKKFDWISYYSNEDSATDYDAIWSALYLSTTNMYFNNEWFEEQSGDMVIIQALGTTLDQGLGGIFGATTTQIEDADAQKVSKKINDICDNVDKLARAWNSVINAEQGKSKINMNAIFSSENASAIVKQLIGIKTKDEDTKVTKERIENYKDGSYFVGMVELFQTGSTDISINIPGLPDPIVVTISHDFEDFEELDIGQKSYDNIREALVSSYDLSELDEEEKQLFDHRMDELLNILFV